MTDGNRNRDKNDRESAGRAKRPARRFWLTGLSTQLLMLTIAFVMLAEVLIFLPSIGRAFELEVRDRIKRADSAIALLDRLPSQALNRDVDMRLLDFADALLIARASDGNSKAIFTSPPKATILTVDVERDPMWSYIAKALKLLVVTDMDAVIGVKGDSPSTPGASVEILFSVETFRQQLWLFARNVLGLSLVISLITAALVYLALQMGIVRPFRKLSSAMIEFADRPLSTFETLKLEDRRDEIGEASEALVSMRQTVRNSLVQNQRLASLGTGVTQINHDLRNLLGTALLLSEQLETSDDARVRQKMPQITSSIEAAADLCQQTLQFAREGSVMLRKTNYDISRLMRELDVQLGLRFSQIDVEVTVPDPSEATSAGPVAVDLIQLDRVLVNLITNAIQAGAVTVWLDAKTSDIGQWQIELSDDGPGFAQKSLNRIFEPFAGTTKLDGTGLGLYNAREVMRAHGGDLTLSDTGPQSGGVTTTFLISFSDNQMKGIEG